MTYLVRDGYGVGDMLASLAVEFYRGGGNGPLSTGTKAEQARKEGIQYGYRSAIAKAMSEIITVERVKKFTGLGHMVVKVDPWNVESVLQKVSNDFTAGAMPSEEEVDALVETLLHLIDGNEGDGKLAEQYEQVRRQLILDGSRQPVAEDRAWLEEMRDEQSKKVADLQAIADLLKPGSEA